MPRRLTHDEKTREERMLSEWRRTRAVYTDDRVPQIDTEEHGFCIKKQLTDAITLIQYNKVLFAILMCFFVMSLC